MQSLKPPGFDKDHPVSKFLQWLPPIGLGLLGILFFGQIAPIFTKAFDNITAFVGSFMAMVITVVVSAVVLWTVIEKRQSLWMLYKSQINKITKFFIKMDFLSIMDTYIEIIEKKRANLQKSLVKVRGKKTLLERQINEFAKSYETNMKQAQAAKKLNKSEKQVALAASMAATDKEAVEELQPLLNQIARSLNFLERVDEDWGISIENLKHLVKTKRTQYEAIREAHKGISEAEMFANTNDEYTKNFHASLMALEESLSNKVAAIEDFERRSKPIMENMELQREMKNMEGLNLLEEYENSNSLFLSITTEGHADVLESKPLNSKSSGFANLLKK